MHVIQTSDVAYLQYKAVDPRAEIFSRLRAPRAVLTDPITCQATNENKKWINAKDNLTCHCALVFKKTVLTRIASRFYESEVAAWRRDSARRGAVVHR
jgi:hypothetical protein